MDYQVKIKNLEYTMYLHIFVMHRNPLRIYNILKVKELLDALNQVLNHKCIQKNAFE